MAPKATASKGEKKAGKAKAVSAGRSLDKHRRRRRIESYNSYIYKVLKQVIIIYTVRQKNRQVRATLTKSIKTDHFNTRNLKYSLSTVTLKTKVVCVQKEKILTVTPQSSSLHGLTVRHMRKTVDCITRHGK